MGKTTHIFIHTHSSPLSRMVQVQRSQRIPGGHCRRDRCSSTRHTDNIFLPSTHISHPTTRTVHRPPSQAQDLQWRKYIPWRWVQLCPALITFGENYQSVPLVRQPSRTARFPVVAFGGALYLIPPSSSSPHGRRAYHRRK